MTVTKFPSTHTPIAAALHAAFVGVASATGSDVAAQSAGAGVGSGEESNNRSFRVPAGPLGPALSRFATVAGGRAAVLRRRAYRGQDHPGLDRRFHARRRARGAAGRHGAGMGARSRRHVHRPAHRPRASDTGSACADRRAAGPTRPHRGIPVTTRPSGSRVEFYFRWGAGDWNNGTRDRGHAVRSGRLRGA
jgi:hypothetical protein